jgi:hypothetical protein
LREAVDLLETPHWIAAVTNVIDDSVIRDSLLFANRHAKMFDFIDDMHKSIIGDISKMIHSLPKPDSSLPQITI